MRERRRRRSGHRNEALRLLLESVHARSAAISSIAIVDAAGNVVVGTGPERDRDILGAVAASAAGGALDASWDALTAGTDVVACPLLLGEQRLYLAALGDRVTRMPEAARGAIRILRTG